MGPVFRAYDPDRDRLVAVKAFRLDLPPERVHQLVAEFEKLIAATPLHPSIVAPLATGIEGVIAYLAQDYVAAESLDIALRQQGRSAASDAVRVATDLAGALDAAAAIQIEHGVLHPRDVLLSADETRVTGFGVARALERVGVPTPVRRPYTAPERTVGSMWDRRADVFSLAALVYEMLWVRRLAGAGDEAARSLTEIAGGDLDALRSVFARALAEDPSQRFDTALEFAGALQEALPGALMASGAGSGQAGSSGRGRLGPDGAERVRLRPERAARLRQQQEKSAHSEPIPEADPFLPLETAADHAVSIIQRPAGETPLAEKTLQAEDTMPGVEALPVVETPPSPEPLLLRTPPPAQIVDLPAPAPDIPVSPPEMFDSYRPGAGKGGGGEESRSSMWPLAFALLIGAAVGFAAGFGVGARGRAADASEPATSVAASPSVPQAAVASTGAAGDLTPGTIASPSRTSVPTAGASTDDNIALPSTPAVAPPGAVDRGAPETQVPAPGRRVPPKPEAAPTGSLLVRSTPLGARVFVDNREYGRTPVTVNMLARGAHRVRVTRDGYVTDERQVTITAAQRAHSITVQLVAERAAAANAGTGGNAARPARGAGTTATSGAAAAPADTVLSGRGPLTIESRPTGAKVFIDGKLAGTTPLTVPDVPAGDHAVHLDLDGYKRWSSAVRVVPSAPNRVAASLDR